MGRQGGGVALYVREQLDCTELDEEFTVNLWVRINDRTGKDDIVHVCYRPPDREEQVDEPLYRQIKFCFSLLSSVTMVAIS